MPRIGQTGEDDRTRRAVARLTGKTRTFSMASAGTKTYTVPADGAGTTDSRVNTCLQLIRAMLDADGDKGIKSVEQT